MGEATASDKQPSLPRPSFIAATAAAGLAAAFIPAAPPGLNLSISAAVIGLAVVLAKSARRSVESLTFGALAALLAMTPIFRSSGWVLGLNLVPAVFLACWAVGGAASWIDLMQAVAAPVGRLPSVPGAFARTLEGARERSRWETVLPVLRGTIFAGLLLLVFGALFVSADAAFAHLVKSLVPALDIDNWLVMRIAVFLIVLAGTLALALAGPRFGTPALNRLVGAIIQGLAPQAEGRRRLFFRLRPLEWIPALAALVLLFISFVAVQITVLFGGHDHVLRTAGLTYAEYAREGFAQLIIVSALTLALFPAATLGFERPSGRDTMVFRAFLGALCLLVLVVLASALHRLGLYEAAFGYTRLRIAAHAVIIWLAGIFLLVGAVGATRASRRLPFILISFSALAVLAFTAVNPDGLIAKRNIERFREGGKLDAAYLSTLSPDAVPALSLLPAGQGDPVLKSISDRLDPDEPWTSWNLGRARARKALATDR